jgi:predicted dehydrogenase
MKVAVIGAGNWGQHLVRNFCALLGEGDVLVSDLDEGRLKEAKEHHPGIAVTQDLDGLLTDGGLDAVVVATPSATHFALAKQALLAGKHVLVEKPISLRLNEAEELIELADRQGRRLMVDHLLEYHPAVEDMKRRVDSGELGEIYYFYSQRLNLGVVRTEENALWSLGPHDISVFLYLLKQEPLRVTAHGGVYLQRGIEDVVFLDLEFPDGVIAHAHLSWLDPQKVRRITIVGSKRMIIFDDTAQEKLTLFDRRVEWRGGGFRLHAGEAHAIELKSEEPLNRMTGHFLESIKNSITPRSDGRDGLRVLRVLAAAQRSLEGRGRPVMVEG